MSQNSTKARKVLTLDKQVFLSMGGSSCAPWLPSPGGRPARGAWGSTWVTVFWCGATQSGSAVVATIATCPCPPGGEIFRIFSFSCYFSLHLLIFTSQWGRWTYCSTFAKTRYALAFTHLCLAFARFLKFSVFFIMLSISKLTFRLYHFT